MIYIPNSCWSSYQCVNFSGWQNFLLLFLDCNGVLNLLLEVGVAFVILLLVVSSFKRELYSLGLDDCASNFCQKEPYKFFFCNDKKVKINAQQTVRFYYFGLFSWRYWTSIIVYLCYFQLLTILFLIRQYISLCATWMHTVRYVHVRMGS